jgi:hypothetical protein
MPLWNGDNNTQQPEPAAALREGTKRDAQGRRRAPPVTLDDANQTTQRPLRRYAAFHLPRPLWRPSNSSGIVR